MTAVSKSWAFTLNNPTPEEQAHILGWTADDSCTLLVVGHEVGAEGTPHLQGIVTFRKAKRLRGVKDLLPRAHLEVALSQKASIAYCRKDGNMLVDWTSAITKVEAKELVWEKARAGQSFTSFCLEHTPTKYVMEHYRMAKLVCHASRPIDPAPTIVWKHGSAGSGKTRCVFEAHPISDIYRPLSYKWWDGYDGHPVVLIDDFRPAWCKFEELLVLLDRYPYSKEIKGGSVGIVATTFYITANAHPAEMFFGLEGENIAQLIRRITRIEAYPLAEPMVV